MLPSAPVGAPLPARTGDAPPVGREKNGIGLYVCCVANSGRVGGEKPHHGPAENPDAERTARHADRDGGQDERGGEGVVVH